ncbi:SAM-dependent methlyltransferase [Oceanicola sp. 22II-s10i]|uniref:RsmB/NOP family class I SAM-dependent RNA methyltransferase n=1 Tax=Oceanicola sp. 22II-s10i TaxID=1317116 RepID=UPI000B51FC32|nr:RsmB/NOP family class I SAM-dependent RNA methyltransferase [Oceanicola sp. 22II-s10i]OWU83454.1 SAM-dependent methlyltransferase [Oceanicola sp. 22II-s10i]
MTPEARIAAAAEVLDRILDGTSATQALLAWGRASRFAGSGDRNAVRDHVYDALRRRRSAAARGGGLTGRGLMIGLLREAGQDPAKFLTGMGHALQPPDAAEAERWRDPEPGAEALDLPDWLAERFRDALGDDWQTAAETLRLRAPVYLRVNLAKIERDQAVVELAASGVTSVPSPVSRTALKVSEGARRIAQTAAYTEGRVELQDLASQRIAEDLPLSDGLRVLDYCAGGGGKALAIAALMRGDIACHDIDPRRMADLPARARRAGVRVALVDRAQVDRAAPYDLVLCDAPCSGSGSWRRDPEGKWALTPERLTELMSIQDSILDEAAALVVPGGMLAYATCSVLKEEDEDRVNAFLGRHPGWVCRMARRYGLDEGGDGFFAAHLIPPGGAGA